MSTHIVLFNSGMYPICIHVKNEITDFKDPEYITFCGIGQWVSLSMLFISRYILLLLLYLQSFLDTTKIRCLLQMVFLYNFIIMIQICIHGNLFLDTCCYQDWWNIYQIFLASEFWHNISNKKNCAVDDVILVERQTFLTDWFNFLFLINSYHVKSQNSYSFINKTHHFTGLYVL